jgi:hypothetical protein
MGTSILQGFLGFSSLSMSQIGSYALLLALALSVYSFLRGMLELLGRSRVPSASGKRRGCTGIATFAAVVARHNSKLCIAKILPGVVHQNLPRTEKAVNPCPLCPRTFAAL